jgi:hypothetical protein
MYSADNNVYLVYRVERWKGANETYKDGYISNKFCIQRLLIYHCFDLDLKLRMDADQQIIPFVRLQLFIAK